eukprot:3932571-Rhodomonas_salina.1
MTSASDGRAGEGCPQRDSLQGTSCLNLINLTRWHLVTIRTLNESEEDMGLLRVTQAVCPLSHLSLSILLLLLILIAPALCRRPRSLRVRCQAEWAVPASEADCATDSGSGSDGG